MKNYYDELEVSKTASKEVIGKVYKVLAKKYHPDTTKETNKQLSEEKFKIISEAYEVLSDDEKRKKYDMELEQSNPTISYQDYINVINQRDNLNNALKNLQNEFSLYKNNVNAQYNRNTQSQSQQNYFNQTQYQNQFNQARYNQSNNQNFNNGYNNYQNPNTNRNYTNPNVNTGKKKKYYYNTVTGQPVSSFEYFKYRMKKFLSNLGFYILLLIILLALLKNIVETGLHGLLF